MPTIFWFPKKKSTMASTPPTATYLRVKRPRHVAPPSSLRVEGLSDNKRARPNNDAVENLASLLHQSTYINQQQQRTATSASSFSSCAVWKRITDDTDKATDSNQKRSFRYVDAVLDTVEDAGPRASKRRRLALTLVQQDTNNKQDDKKEETTKQPNKKKKNVILDPLSRLVQDSLQSVFSGEVSIAQHVAFLSEDSRLCDTPRVWLAWEDTYGKSGNVLHAAALLNNAEGATAVLQWNVPSLLFAVNQAGQTPYQVAVAVGHLQVAQVLQEPSAASEEKDGDFVYDVFCLDQDMKEDDDEEDEEPTSVELRGGIGYWNENGQLILEALQEMKDNDSDEDDDDEDSNCEDYYQNDYPEEEEEEVWDSDEDEVSFRHRPIFLSSPNGRVENRPTLVDDVDEEYDAQYDLYEPNEPQREYAYDPELDSDSDD